MRATDFFQFASWVVYAAIFLLAARRTLRRPLRSNVDIALFFGDAAAIVVLMLVATARDVADSLIVAIATGAFGMALPYLLLRLVVDFAEVPPLLMHGAEAGLVLSVLLLVAFGVSLPVWATLMLVAYFVATIACASWMFVRQAHRTSGVTRRRMQAVALGSLLLGLDVALVGAAALAPAVADGLTLLGTLCGVASGLSYCSGFVPPTWLRRAWQEPEVRAFLGRVARLPRLPELPAVVCELEDGVAAAVGAPSAAIGLWMEHEQVLRFFDKSARTLEQVLEPSGASPESLGVRYAEGVFDLPPGQMTAGQAFASQEPVLAADTVRQDPEHAAFYRSVGIQSTLAAPITAADQRFGVLVVYAPRAPIFAESDLELVQLLADQAAVLLESRALLEEAAQAHAGEEANRLKDAFLATISHDLRNPITAVRSTAQVLRRRLKRDGALDLERLDSALGNIERSTGQMAGLVDQVMDYARLQMDRPLELRRQPTDLVVVAERVAQTQQAASERHHIHVEAAEPALTGSWDEQRLERVLQNLVGNALKYSPDGGEVEVRIWREGSGAAALAVLSVRDYGVGIPAPDLPHIFEPFHRAGNVTGQIAGTGIGLAISRQVVEQHGGSLTVESEEGQGSTFTVRLPLGSEQPPSTTPPARQAGSAPMQVPVEESLSPQSGPSRPADLAWEASNA